MLRQLEYYYYNEKPIKLKLIKTVKNKYTIKAEF